MARGPSRRVEALVLDRTKLGESDLIVTLLGSDGAMLRAVAKGARRPGGRLAAPTELYGRADVLLAPGRSLWVLTDGRRLQPPARMGEDVAMVAGAAAIAEAVRLSVPEGVEDPFVYALVLRAYEVLAGLWDRSAMDVVVAATVLKLLSHLGWRPGLDGCVVCGDPEVGWLSLEAGGTLCDDCAAQMESEVPGSTPHVHGPERLDGRRLAWLRSLVSARLNELAGSAVDPDTARWLAGFAREWTAYHLDARPKAFDVLLAL